MKHFLVLTFIFCMASGLLFSREESIYWIEIFELHGERMFRVSIESKWERNGGTPVVLSFGGLETSLMFNADDLAAAAGGDNTWISKMLTGDMSLFLTSYEQNPVRTRMRLLDKNKPVILKINRENQQVEFYIGNKRLKLNPIRISFRVIAPVERGLYELIFEGTDAEVHTYKRFIFQSAAGTIYAVPPYKAIADSDLNSSRIWAIEVNQTIIKKGGSR